MPIAQGRTVDQTSHQLVCDALRGVLHRAVHAGPGAVDGIGSIQCQASAVLYLLLRDHPVDRRGRCRSCRRSGAMVCPRRQCCRIHRTASYWLLRQPDKAQLLSYLAVELGLDTAPHPVNDPAPAGTTGRDGRTRLTAGPGMTPREPPVPPCPSDDPDLLEELAAQ